MEWNGGQGDGATTMGIKDFVMQSGVVSEGTAGDDVLVGLFGRCKLEAANDTEERMAA